jgi:lambda repressor-like predicted transcriptional regulator
MPRPEPCPHPYPPKLSWVIAEDVRRMRRKGLSVTAIAKRYGVAKSSISAVLKLHTYVPDYVIAIGLKQLDRALLREIAEDEKIADEQLAAELVASGMQRRIAREMGIAFEESSEPRRRRQGR